MATFDRSAAQHVNLFPMFNLLLCTLGVLVFILITITIISMGTGKRTAITPMPSAAGREDKEALYLEWTGLDIVAHPSRDALRLQRDVRAMRTWRETFEYFDGALAGTTAGRLIADAADNASSRYIVVLIRPSGFESFINLRGYIESKGIDIGYEPIDDDWIVRMGQGARR
ncbi:hypothetical protein [Haliangium ochraceum]|uniref:Uncharacterized protein n=1 Tax=Haliangium ochraceum (strain DSM 14365 / JCM 11303 / SMP-2) TaxID=502025 RepID=D0LS32_HALO1|nr:hypothetical protein [Haliangium ochraceum]ACY13729.1 hypothetical protein Hoch_1159 [Haliangium ochraceum DSM 14365]